jgi:hypothetical protein
VVLRVLCGSVVLLCGTICDCSDFFERSLPGPKAAAGAAVTTAFAVSTYAPIRPLRYDCCGTTVSEHPLGTTHSARTVLSAARTRHSPTCAPASARAGAAHVNRTARARAHAASQCGMFHAPLYAACCMLQVACCV